MVPVWSGTCYHLRGNYCSFNCAKSDVIAKARSGQFPRDATALGLFAFQIAWKGKHCPHSSRCSCYSRFTGVVPAPDKESLQAFGGPLSIREFRKRALTIESYDWVSRFYSPREQVPEGRVPYLYTLQPVRRVKLVDVECDEDPVVFIKRRVF